ncbi:MAG: class I SAM-dependent methyltransferase [Dermatophilaceae bacterium]
MEAKDWDTRYAAGRQWSVEPNRWVVQELSSLLPGRALDAACGEGRNAIWLAQEGWSVLGIDFSQQALDRAAQVAADVAGSGTPLDVEWLCLDITERQAVTGQFDLVLCAYVHLPAYERTPMVRAVAAALSTGGTLLVIGHDSTNLAEGYGGPQDAELLYTAQDVAADLQDIISSGVLTVERASRVAREVETAEGPQVAWDFLFRARRRDNTKDELSFV